MNLTIDRLTQASSLLRYELLHFECRLERQREQLAELITWVDKLSGRIAKDEVLLADVAAEIEALNSGNFSSLSGPLKTRKQEPVGNGLRPVH